MDNGATDEVPSQYKEKKWGKTEDGEYIVDGFTFRGKRSFAKVVEGLNKFFKKGIEHDIVGYEEINKVKALDVREKGNGLEIDVEITEKNGRGVAVLKLYGPNTRKENVVMVTTSEQSDSKYVTLLANGFIKPWMKKKLSGSIDNPLLQKSVSVRGKRIILYKCPHCDVTSHSSPGLKGHITKKHTGEKKMKIGAKSDEAVLNKKHKLNETDLHVVGDENTSEANQVINLLLNYIVEIVDGTEHISENANVETSDCLNDTLSKRYRNNCDKCEFVVDATKRYVALQLLKKHKTTNHCPKCDFSVNNYIILRRHMRDEHDLKTVSTSPPPKKRKPDLEIADEDEPMDTETNDDVKDLSSTFEDMEIENSDSDIFEIRSNVKDKLIKEKERKEEEMENVFDAEKKEADKLKLVAEEKKKEIDRGKNKKRKQRSKDARKVENKRNKKNISVSKKTGKVKCMIGNIRNIPNNCKHLVEEGDVLYVVPGDGCCGPNCAAALLFGDEVFGPKLRRHMNKFMAKHWNRRYKSITQCSPGHPFERKLANRVVKFTEPKKLLEFLKNSEEASYMWTDSEDLAVLADMYQMKIKIITTKGDEDKNPTVNCILPENTMKEYAEVKM